MRRIVVRNVYRLKALWFQWREVSIRLQPAGLAPLAKYALTDGPAQCRPDLIT